MQQELSGIEERLEYRSEERARDLQDAVEQCATRVSVGCMWEVSWASVEWWWDDKKKWRYLEIATKMHKMANVWRESQWGVPITWMWFSNGLQTES